MVALIKSKCVKQSGLLVTIGQGSNQLPIMDQAKHAVKCNRLQLLAAAQYLGHLKEA